MPARFWYHRAGCSIGLLTPQQPALTACLADVIAFTPLVRYGGLMRIAVFGLGYVGTVTAAGLASCGHQVWGVDVDPAKVDLLGSGRSPIVEPRIDDLVAASVRSGALRVTRDAAEALDRADVSLLCVGTPSTPRGDTDLTYLRRALADLRAAMLVAAPPDSGRHAVVIRSTVPPGTGAEVVAPAFADAPAPGWQVGTAMCPEFLREGSSVADFFEPPMVVVGSEEPWVGALVAEVFGFLDRQVRHVGVPTAEALKYACNAYHAAKVSFANEMGRVFRAYGVDSREVMDVFAEDHVLNISAAYLRPGFAFGGSCLPKDLRALLHMARMNSLDVPLLSGVLRTNELVIRDVVDRLVAGRSRTVALLGLSFKSDTDDLRESPSVELAEQLIGKGFELRVYDPIVHPERLIGANLRHIEARMPHLRRVLFDSPGAAMAGAGTAVVATSDPAVVAQLRAAPPPRIVDLSGRLGAAVEALPGYEGVGWAR
jgi:GDP-mannose 6-dehydrogenase